MSHHTLIVRSRSSHRSSQAGLFHIPVLIQSFITNSLSSAKISRWMLQPQSLIGSAAAPHIFHILQLKTILSEMCHVRMASPKPLPQTRFCSTLALLKHVKCIRAITLRNIPSGHLPLWQSSAHTNTEENAAQSFSAFQMCWSL